MMTDEKTDTRGGATEFELSVGQTFYEFTPIEEIAEYVAGQAKSLFLNAMKGRKTAKGRINFKLHS